MAVNTENVYLNIIHIQPIFVLSFYTLFLYSPETKDNDENEWNCRVRFETPGHIIHYNGSYGPFQFIHCPVSKELYGLLPNRSELERYFIKINEYIYFFY